MNIKTIHKTEPVLTWATLAAIFNGLQLVTLSLPTWAHTVITVGSIVATAIATRGKVTPTK